MPWSTRAGGRRGALLAAVLILMAAVSCTTKGDEHRAGDSAGDRGVRADESATSVKTFGARGDGATDDSRSFQAAVDSLAGKGGTITVPAGVYRFASTVVIRHSNVAIRGEGTQSVLTLADGAKTNIFLMPAPYGVYTTDIVVTDVKIFDLVLDGNRNGGPRDTPTFFGIHIRRAERVEMSGLVLRDWPFDAISIGVGEKPNLDITVRNSRFTGIGRNAIHLGYGRNLRISDVFVEDTPSQQWGPASGNAVDIEVEGQDSFVDGFVIENSMFVRAGTRTAGYGIALQPAFGPIRNGIIRGNVIRNHPHGVFVGTAEGITVADNWVLADDSLSTGAGITVYDGHARVENNVLNLLRWPVHGFAGLLIKGATSALTVKGNNVWGGLCSVRVQDGRHLLAVDGNEWGNESGCFVDPGSPAAPVQQAGNHRLQVPTLDQVPPVVKLDVTSSKVRALPVDAGAGVARVLFLVDGIPRGFVDSAPFDLELNPLGLAPGQHTVEALAVDEAANVSALASAEVRVRS